MRCAPAAARAKHGRGRENGHDVRLLERATVIASGVVPSKFSRVRAAVADRDYRRRYDATHAAQKKCNCCTQRKDVVQDDKMITQQRG